MNSILLRSGITTGPDIVKYDVPGSGDMTNQRDGSLLRSFYSTSSRPINFFSFYFQMKMSGVLIYFGFDFD